MNEIIKELDVANGMKKRDVLKSGKVLTVPSNSTYTLYNKYSIKKGDTLYSGLSIDNLKKVTVIGKEGSYVKIAITNDKGKVVIKEKAFYTLYHKDENGLFSKITLK